ncbi:MAG: ABC transporter permease [Deltaproteobacteria bacterium]|nr:MAG: ABC transporter permease [Deltaproteobacteria bacterium]
MTLSRALRVVFGNIRRNKRAFILSSVGLIIGVATLTFFVALGMGVQAGVLNKIYPVNQVEIEPQTVGIVGLREQLVDASRLDADMIAELKALPDVTRVYPKLRSKLQARLWGGKSLFGYAARTEAFFDGLDPTLVSDELQRVERVEEKRHRASLRRPLACKRNDECPLGQVCGADGRCGDIEYWQRFADHGIAVPCDAAAAGDDACPPATTCTDGVCRAPATACTTDGDCPTTDACVGEAGARTCQRMACELSNPNAQFSERLGDQAGRVLGRCANAVAPDSPACEPLPCPDGTYCAASSVATARGYCEDPIPVLLSPVLLEIFNSSVASSLGMQRIDGTDAMLGFQFRLQLGDSYFAADLPVEMQAVKRAEIVGFSQKAMEFGVTMPLGIVRALNARYKGRAAADTYDTFILETQGNEDVSKLIAEVEGWGFTLSRKSEDARKAADLLFILTVVFSFISVVIMFVAAVNIMHTFLTLVTERRYEIGIMRAVGAARADIRKLFLLEAGVLGVFGGVLGNVVAWGASRLVNWVAAEYLQGIPFKPDEFFVYDWRILVGGVLFAWLFCVLGAWLPANRAARLDPAVVLTT